MLWSWLGKAGLVRRAVAARVDGETGQLGAEPDHRCRLVAADAVGRGIDVQAADDALLAASSTLHARRRPGERQEAGDVEAGVVLGHREAARLEVAVAVGIVAQAVAQVDLADDLCGSAH